MCLYSTNGFQSMLSLFANLTSEFSPLNFLIAYLVLPVAVQICQSWKTQAGRA